MRGQKSVRVAALFGLCAILSLGVSSESHAAGKKSKKKDAEAATSQEGGESAASTETGKGTARAGKASLAKPGQGTSVGGSVSVGDSLGEAKSETLLSQGMKTQTPKAGAQVEGATKTIEEMKKKAPTLSLGVFRSENISGGQVNAPGIADFAAYFRATSEGSSAAPNATKQGQAHKAAAPAVGVHDGAAPETGGLTHVQLGASTDDMLKRQAAAEKLRAQTSDSIRKILQTNPSNDQKVDLQMRLAEIQVERHAYLLEFEIKEFNEAHDAWKQARKGPEPIFKTDKSMAQLLVAIQALRTVVTQFPNSARAPEALFNLGFLLSQTNSDSAALYFEKLVKNYPKSEYVPDAYLSLGEWHFSRLSWPKAQENYQKVLDHKGTRAYPYAVYKLGWTYFNLPSDKAQQQNLVKSLAAFKLVVKLSEAPDADKTVKSLRNEALKDMVLVFAEIGDIGAAQRYFDSLGEQTLYFTLLERLAWQNAEAGKYGEAVSIYARLIKEAPLSARLPTYYAKSAELAEKQMQRPALIRTLQAAALVLGDDSEWMKKNASDKTAMAAREDVLGKETRLWAARFHQEAQKNKREASYDDALACYDIYLARYGERSDAYASRFYRAEIYVHKGKMLEAADEYMKAVDLDEKNAIKGKHTRDAILNSIVAVDNVLTKSQAPKLPEAAKAPQPIPLTQLHARLVKALDAFTRLYPTDAETLAISHRAAGVVYAFGDYASANTRWTAIAKRHPESKEAFSGVRLVVKVPVDRKEWPTAIAEARKFISIPGVKGTKLGDDLSTVLKGSVFQQALALEKADKRSEAAALFLSYHKEFQNDADAPKSLFNAANNKFRLGKMDEAIGHLQTLIAQYPKSDLTPNVLYLVASSYDALGQFADAAASYEQLARENPKLDAAPEALLRATVQRNATGDHDKAVKDATDFIQAYPAHKDVSVAWAQLGTGHSKLGDETTAHKMLSQGAETLAKLGSTDSRRPKSLFLYGMAAQAALRSKDKVAATKYYQAGVTVHAALGAGAKDPQALEGARQLGLTQVDMLDEQVVELYKRQITDGMKLTEQFTKIRDDVQGLAAKYLAVAKLGNAESGIGALYRVAEMQEFLATMLLKAPVPGGAKPEEVEQFRSTLERIALPLQEEATNLYVKAWERASETEAMSPFTRKLHDKLAVLRPGEFTKVIEDMPSPSYYSSDVVLTKETKPVFRN